MPVKSKRTFEDYFPYAFKADTPVEKVVFAFHVGDISASKNVHLIAAPFELKITAVKLLVDTAIAANDDNYWSAQLVNLTQNDNLLSSAKTSKATGGTAFTADSAWTITPDQTQYLRINDVLELQLTKSGSASSLSNLVIQVEAIITGKVATTTSTSSSTSTTTTTSTSTSTSTTTT